MARYVYKPGHPRASKNGFVNVLDLGDWTDGEAEARFSPINSGRHYENLAATDGTDIGSRRKHREYMRRNNLTTADDFKETWAKKQAEMDARRAGTYRDPKRAREIREVIGRALYEADRRR